jgi:hypothetical protein
VKGGYVYKTKSATCPPKGGKKDRYGCKSLTVSYRPRS